jgi:peptidoglycan/LPS O-acetylase OafA/YrhL
VIRLTHDIWLCVILAVAFKCTRRNGASLQATEAIKPAINAAEPRLSGSVAPIHFPWLTEMRFLTAFAVLIHHIETTRNVMGLGPYPQGLMQVMGPNGVRVFFVLSGFLITHLLLSEVQRTGTVAVKKFYIRRALRIWPLYYALLAVSFLIPSAFCVVKVDSQMTLWATAQMQDFWPKITLFICMLPNLAILLFQPVAAFAQAWSIGVEEQFYFVWPVLMKRFAARPLVALLGVLVTKVATFEILLCVLKTRRLYIPTDGRVVLGHLFNFVNSCQIEAMVIGGLAAYLLLKNPLFVQSILRKKLFLVLLGLGLVWANSANFTQPQHLIPVDCIFAAFLGWLTNQRIKPPETLRAGLTYLGKISYGIYMLHPLAIYLSYKAVCSTGIDTTSFAFTAAIWGASIFTSIAFAMGSYELYEKRFLKLKSNYAVVASSAG